MPCYAMCASICGIIISGELRNHSQRIVLALVSSCHVRSLDRLLTVVPLASSVEDPCIAGFHIPL